GHGHASLVCNFRTQSLAESGGESPKFSKLGNDPARPQTGAPKETRLVTCDVIKVLEQRGQRQEGRAGQTEQGKAERAVPGCPFGRKDPPSRQAVDPAAVDGRSKGNSSSSSRK
ncbi:hypothetical protein AK812_SmicGene45284, partial [Symbiodinium microadriaticum]